MSEIIEAITAASYQTTIDQTSTMVTATSAETGTTLKTSPTPSYTRYAERKAICEYDLKHLGPGPTDGDAVRKTVKEFCGRPDIDHRMKATDKCIKESLKDSIGKNYDFAVCPVNNCRDWGENVNDPLGQKGFSCEYIFSEHIWNECKVP
jgi:hypothetical protein